MTPTGESAPSADSQPIDAQAALEDALYRRLGGLLTEPMSKTQLAGYFKVSCRTMGDMLRRMDGVEQHGTLYRVPIVKMPPKYHLHTGLILPVDGRKCA